MTISIRTLALAAVVALPSIAAVPAAAASGPDAMRAETATQISAILGDSGLARIKPIVDDATNRAVAAVKNVGTTDKTPRQILDRSQRFHLLLTRGEGIADLNLRSEQRAELATYATDVLRCVRPIVETDGHQIDAALTPQQSAALISLEHDTIVRLSSKTPDGAAALGIDPVAVLSAGPELTPGQFVLLAELDYRSIASRSR